MAKKVLLGLSGGVDSAVAAWLLKEKGYDVTGLFMINWKDSSVTLSGDCSWEEDMIMAQLVARTLGIGFMTVDSSDEYMSRVAEYMFTEYQKGRTPNPDVLCNREIKFDIFTRAAGQIGAEFVATGHYSRKDEFKSGDKTIYRLLAGEDKSKDQSYFLCQLSQEQLAKAIFPLGSLQKSQVRKYAAELNLPNATKKDSQGLCFVGKVDLPVFLQQRLESRQGNIVEILPWALDDHFKRNAGEFLLDEDLKNLSMPHNLDPGLGEVIGTQQGAWFYTIGQRKGVGIGGKAEPLFVIGLDPEKNIVYVGQGKTHPGLFRPGLFIAQDEINWLRTDLQMQDGESRRYHVRIRYRQELQPATIYCRNEGLYVLFDNPQRGITPGQFAAWYDGEELLGSGVINR